MAYQPITRTAPGWEERTALVLPPGVRTADGAGSPITLRPGFARLALLLEVTQFGGGSGLRVWIQHSPDGVRWLDLAAFDAVDAAGAQVAWVEAQPALAGSVGTAADGQMAPATVHQGFALSRLRARWSTGGVVAHAFAVEAVAIYERR
jgi:hypothetical protein